MRKQRQTTETERQPPPGEGRPERCEINAFALLALIGDIRRFEHAGKSLTLKLNKLAVLLGKALRKELAFPPSLAATVELLRSRIIPPGPNAPA